MIRALYVIALVFGMMVSVSFPTQSVAGEELYKMTGHITAIDLEYRTVVIEVPMVGKTFTVGGPLASGAVLKRGDVSVDLRDLQVGDQVVVTWRSTPEGHLILSLAGEVTIQTREQLQIK
jgi:hypothetical protein